MRLAVLTLLIALCCAACKRTDESAVPVEKIVVGPVRLEVAVEGEIRSSKATPLTVPGKQWTSREPIWLLTDGEPVIAGQLIARFSTQQSELELAQIVIDLERNQLSRLAKEITLDSDQSHVSIDLIDVATRLAIAGRYADLDLASYFSRNEVLDALDDKQFLGTRREVLEWKRRQSKARGETEFAVFDAQKASHERNASVRRKELDASELRAPHAGVLMLATNWAGEKPRAGINMMAGQVLGYLPDIEQMEVEMKLPQTASEGLSIGQKAQVHLVGRPASKVVTALSSVAATAQPRNRENLAPYITVKAPLPKSSVRALGLVPGMRIEGRIQLLDAASGISVPNIAVIEEGEHSIVYVQKSLKPERREIELGVRGIARSEVRKGLSAGELVVLTPPRETAPASSLVQVSASR